jgi:hypothetical protein
MDPKRPDPEMLKSMDLLLDLDTLEDEADWELLTHLDEAESMKTNVEPTEQNQDEENK